MARIRTFKPEFWSDEKTSRLSRDARLLFFGLLSEADDEGRLVDSPKRLAGVVFPFDDDVTAKRIERWISELEAVQMVQRYSVDGGRYLHIPKFTKHQKISHSKASSLPSPSGAPPEIPPTPSGAPPDNFAPEGKGNKGTREQGKGNAAAEPPASPLPEDFQISDHLREWATSEGVKLDLQAETVRFMEYYRAKGEPLEDWDNAWRGWMRRAGKFTNGKKTPKDDGRGDQVAAELAMASRSVCPACGTRNGMTIDDEGDAIRCSECSPPVSAVVHDLAQRKRA